MKIAQVETIAYRSMGGTSPSGPHCASPMDAFYDPIRIAPDQSGRPRSAILAVRVTTDDGVYGLGSVGGAGLDAAKVLIDGPLSRLVIDQDPFAVEYLWELMFRGTMSYGRKGVVIEAISGIDIALWDIMGKVTGQPIYNLLGGKTRGKIRAYASRLYARAPEHLDELAAEAQEYLDQGYTAMKQRLAYGPRHGVQGMRKNLELIRTVRAVVGPDVELAVDVYMGWDPQYAIRMIRMIEDDGLDIAWLEEPTIPDDIDGYAEIRANVNTPIAGGEHEFTRYGFRQMLDKHAVDIVQLDVNRVGGITEARKIWAMAAGAGFPLLPHAGYLHNFHLIMAHMNSPIAECLPRPPERPPVGSEMLAVIFRGQPEPSGGFVELAEVPGMGYELDQEALAKYAIGREG